MMHGYLAFDNKSSLLKAYRTWRNTNTQEVANKLTDLFKFNIPVRWSVSHLYQAMLNKEAHLNKIDFLTTLSGYISWKLTCEKVIGIGDASGMFPIDTITNNYHPPMIEKFKQLPLSKTYPRSIENILPETLAMGIKAGRLTKAGALLLDPSRTLLSGVSLCPPGGVLDGGGSY